MTDYEFELAQRLPEVLSHIATDGWRIDEATTNECAERFQMKVRCSVIRPNIQDGWPTIGTAGRLVGHFYIHNGDDSAFVCERG
ncbi:hypothetical protein L6654_30430 [Bradyrhizobium sp. WYCCWR 13023]|uniref:Uncharacterized protein n=1 Tax=Bradyrhizobium zhengyangense TaxID=2911009 RepID=A0A9X1RHZ8_9BRAD|nr:MULTISPECIES: hypothetical protein [Bradyrhizobium]MCG2630954.1 hypothetical protein [Bradyrhizobium zhengyangense]MCG2644573.1 hypothetical protein [Bradyrhizobium zhengyangense]MCG2672173.1 hypothetical protein [Bradyrhizobium zhengyangense]